ncbi:hypothetical protein SCACP_27970 [Sporomusa carbonis]
MFSYFKTYYAEKEQLLTEIDRLIRKLEQARQTGQKSNAQMIAAQLEKCLRQLYTLRQTKAKSNRTTL